MDILAEVDRQRFTQAQAGKARRFIELRNRMRQILAAVFSTRAEMLIDQQDQVEIAIALIGGEGKHLEQEIERLNALVRVRRTEVGTQEHTLEERRDRRSDVELEHETVSGSNGYRIRSRLSKNGRPTCRRENRMLEDLERNGKDREARGAQLSAIDREKEAVERRFNC